ncbi:FolC bifunctional protein [Punctularia strigosozonata HHB-11173 SS5]|uniref:FolC bifunctional protein n=1 Tax=Punctularia strigosozonata (strain HHB-11173) TaxID=741275 RepID=UPI000441697B|nr:FolC bifunctional protein [Punctularia strigosozonata HHB-11173 SS5]EIN10312.1 FolC bifunctional protein [Punctularia strigosozonata HHB-11173 SS5]
MSGASKTYTDAVAALNDTQSNAATLDAVRASGGRLSQFAIPEMIEYLHRIGYTPEDLNRMNVIHVTGTKGKGSTCAFVDSILRRERPSFKVGLYTSPHLVAVRERIRINGTPISEELFAKFFFEVYDRLSANTKRAHESTPEKPNYFRFVTLVAYHAFLQLGVDATILEVGVGGMYDSTNIVPKPIVTGVTALGIDHVGVLGKTLPEIAWQKGGIYKEGVPALSVAQPEEALEVLRKQAIDRKASEFIVVPDTAALYSIKLGLPGAHQRQNANLAIHLVRTFLANPTIAAKSNRPPPTFDSEGAAPLPATFVGGLQNARWPGRCQTVPDPDPANAKTTWYLDGAHTKESLEFCMAWYVSPGAGLPLYESAPRPMRVLVFNCTAGRSGPALLGGMLEKTASQLQIHHVDKEAAAEDLEGTDDDDLDPNKFFDHVIFCSNVTYADGGYKGDLTSKNVHESDLAKMKVQNELAAAWTALVPSFPKSNIHVLPSIEHAIRTVRGLQTEERPVKVLVTGSLHLVGGVIEVAGLAKVAL